MNLPGSHWLQNGHGSWSYTLRLISHLQMQQAGLSPHTILSRRCLFLIECDLNLLVSEFDMFKYRFPIHKIVTKMNGYEHHNRYGKEEGKWVDDRGTRMHECRGHMGSDEGHMGSGPMRFRGLRPIVLDLISDSPQEGIRDNGCNGKDNGREMETQSRIYLSYARKHGRTGADP